MCMCVCVLSILAIISLKKQDRVALLSFLLLCVSVFVCYLINFSRCISWPVIFDCGIDFMCVSVLILCGISQ